MLALCVFESRYTISAMNKLFAPPNVHVHLTSQTYTASLSELCIRPKVVSKDVQQDSKGVMRDVLPTTEHISPLSSHSLILPLIPSPSFTNKSFPLSNARSMQTQAGTL